MHQRVRRSAFVVMAVCTESVLISCTKHAQYSVFGSVLIGMPNDGVPRTNQN